MRYAVYQEHRKQLMQMITDGLIVLKAPPVSMRNADTAYPFHQESYFNYLTGIMDPDYLAVLDPKRKKSTLFVPDISTKHLIWEGKLLSKEAARKKYGFHAGFYLSEFTKMVKTMSHGFSKVHVLDHDSSLHRQLPKALKRETHFLKQKLVSMRLIKSPEELRLMQKANAICANAHILVMQKIRTLTNECAVQGLFEKLCRDHGVKHFAYPPICAAGRNAATLHYTRNDGPIKKNELFLIDAGCEWQGYASDITRTYPAGGKFTQQQREIYAIVLNTQKKCLRQVRPGISMIDLHILAVKEILKGLGKLGFFKTPDIETLVKNNVHSVFFPHGLGHLLGLDTHDVTLGKRSRRKTLKYLRSTLILKPGMVITVEPGIYFIEVYFKDAEMRKPYNRFINWRIARKYFSVGGVRIEDDVIVSKTSHRNLTKVPKEISDIERIVRGKN